MELPGPRLRRALPPRPSNQQRPTTSIHQQRRGTPTAAATTWHTNFTDKLGARQQEGAYGPATGQNPLERQPGTSKAYKEWIESQFLKFGLCKPNHYTWYQTEPQLWRFINEKPDTEPPQQIDIASILRQTSDFMQHHPPRGTPAAGQHQQQPDTQPPAQQQHQPEEESPPAQLPEPQQQPAEGTKAATSATAEAKQRLSQGTPYEKTRSEQDRSTGPGIPQPQQPPRLGGGRPSTPQQPTAGTTNEQHTLPPRRSEHSDQHRTQQPQEAAAGQNTQRPQRNAPPEQGTHPVTTEARPPSKSPRHNATTKHQSNHRRGRQRGRVPRNRRTRHQPHGNKQQRVEETRTPTQPQRPHSRHPAAAQATTSKQRATRCTPAHTEPNQRPTHHDMGSWRHQARAAHATGGAARHLSANPEC